MSDHDDRTKSDPAPQPDRTMEYETPGPGRGGPRFGPVGGGSGEGLEPGRIVGEPFPVPGEVEAGSDWPDRDEWALPTHYGEDAVVALVRDPWWMFVYWELSDETRQAAREKAGEGARFMIRLHVQGEESRLAEVEVPDIEVGDWYVQAHAPRQVVQATMGFLDAEEHFFPVLDSAEVRVPAFEPVPPLSPRPEGADQGLGPWVTTAEPVPPVGYEPRAEAPGEGGPGARSSEELLFEYSGGRELENASRWRQGRTRPVIWRRRKFGGWASVRDGGSGSGAGARWEWEMEEVPGDEAPPAPAPTSPGGPVSSPTSPFGYASPPPWKRSDPEGSDE